MSQQQFSYKEIINSQLPQDLYKIGKDIESQAIGSSLDKVQADVNKLELEANPLTSKDKGLENWENFFKLPSNIDEVISSRRARVISELIQFMSDENVITKEEMESIVSLFADDCKVIEHFSDYIFDVMVKVTGENESVINFEEIAKVVQQIKPSWLKYNLGLKFKVGAGDIHIASCLNISEVLTVYPYPPVDVMTTRGTMNLGSASRVIEILKVYPKREV